MSSAAEQLAANFNWGAFSKATDLKKRLWFTLGALVIYRFGSYIPLPGINQLIMQEIASQNSGGILSIIDTFSGGALSRMTIFALNIMPYISASIIVQLMTAVSPQLEALKKEGETGRKKLNQYTRYLTVLLATVQSFGIANGLEVMTGPGGTSAVMDPGFLFRFSTVVTLTGGTMFLMWLGEQITSRGIGNGASLLIFTGIVANLPHALVATLELGRTGALSPLLIMGVIVLVVAVIAFIVYMERAQRRIYIQYPKQRMQGQNAREGSHLPMKINVAGVIPPIFAGSLLGIPATILSFSASSNEWVIMLQEYITRGHLGYIGVYITLIVFFSFFYTSVVFNPEETAENLKKAGGFVAGYRPGKATADHLDYILTRLTVLGSAYLCFICILPEILMTKLALPFYFGGTSLLIVVSVTMDTVTQIHSHMLSHQYEGLLKKSRLKGVKGGKA